MPFLVSLAKICSSFVEDIPLINSWQMSTFSSSTSVSERKEALWEEWEAPVAGATADEEDEDEDEDNSEDDNEGSVNGYDVTRGDGSI